MSEPPSRRWRSGYAALFYLFVAIAQSWPLTVTLAAPSSLRGDYFGNVWNAWWVGEALGSGESLFHTEHIFYPEGVDLGLHTLSPLNAVTAAALASVVSVHAAINLLLLAHLVLAGWGMFLLARYLSGSTAGALLAGLLYIFNPFHFYVLAQINVFSTGFLPLAVFFFLRGWKSGSRFDLLAGASTLGLLAASCEYYLVYVAGVAAVLAVAARWWAPAIPWKLGFGRALRLGLLGGLLVFVVAWPLLRASLGRSGEAIPSETSRIQEGRASDLLGFNWLGPPEQLRVSWPTMLGYSTLLLLLFGWRGVARRPEWLLVAAGAFVLGLGPSLTVGGESWGIPLPYRLLESVPVLSMLRKPDRMIQLLLLALAVLLAHAWKELIARRRERRERITLTAVVALLLSVELGAAPLQRFEIGSSPWFEELREDPSVHAIVHLPAFPGTFYEAKYDYLQTKHEKRMPQGYLTSLAFGPEHRQQSVLLMAADRELTLGRAEPMSRLSERLGLDRIVLHHETPQLREASELDGTVVWAPFVAVRRELIAMRQLGPIVHRAPPERYQLPRRRALETKLGPPLYEDDSIAVFELP